MMQNNFPHLKITPLYQSQSQKELTINEALLKIDSILNTAVIDILQTPPEKNKNGDLYIIGEKPLEAWKNKTNDLAYYYDGWRFLQPNPGLTLWILKNKTHNLWNGDEWVPIFIENTKEGKNDNDKLAPPIPTPTPTPPPLPSEKSNIFENLSVTGTNAIFSSDKNNKFDIKINKNTITGEANIVFTVKDQPCYKISSQNKNLIVYGVNKQSSIPALKINYESHYITYYFNHLFNIKTLENKGTVVIIPTDRDYQLSVGRDTLIRIRTENIPVNHSTTIDLIITANTVLPRELSIALAKWPLGESLTVMSPRTIVFLTLKLYRSKIFVINYKRYTK